MGHGPVDMCIILDVIRLYHMGRGDCIGMALSEIISCMMEVISTNPILEFSAFTRSIVLMKLSDTR